MSVADKNKKTYSTLLLLLVFLLLVVFTYRNWFTFKYLSGGDWPFLFFETIKGFSLLPVVWSYTYSGMGISNYMAGLGLYFEFTSKFLSKLFFPWFLIEKLVWFWPFLVLTEFSSWYLAKTLFPKEKIIQILTPLIYLFNSYIFMIVGGGQIGVAIVYSLTPLVFAQFVKTTSNARVKQQLIFGLVLATQFLFDPRICAVTIGITIFYAVFQYRLALRKYLQIFPLPLLLVLGINAFWLLPSFLNTEAVLPVALKQTGWVEFFSFANFSNSFSLLHPNWPENIFGKTYLIRPEFLVLPVFAYLSLLFVSYPVTGYGLRVRKQILFFCLLGLVGSFLAKGVNPPFGFINRWLYENIPGMKIFRDPSKFYLLVALSYSLLIPFSLEKIYLRIFKS